MDDLELVIADTVANAIEILGMPPDLCERLVRHCFECPNPRCGVRDYLESSAKTALARTTGVSEEKLQEIASANLATTEAQIRHLRKLHGEVSAEQLQAAYAAGRDATEASIEYLRGSQ